LTFNGLHGVISQKIVLFITPAVRTSNPTQFKVVLNKEIIQTVYELATTEAEDFPEGEKWYISAQCTTWHCIVYCPPLYISQRGAGITRLVKRLDYGPDDREIGVRFQTWTRDSSLFHNVQTDSGTIPASNKLVPGTVSSVVKRQGRETYHSLPSSAEVKND
jgi:hypothetical protein